MDAAAAALRAAKKRDNGSAGKQGGWKEPKIPAEDPVPSVEQLQGTVPHLGETSAGLPTRWGLCRPRHADIVKAHSPFPPFPFKCIYKCMRAPTVALSKTRTFEIRGLHVAAMKHVSEGGLPAHLEKQRTRMFVKNAAPEHTSTVEAASAYAASGLENSFSIERFRRDFRVEIQSLSAEEAVFDLIGIDAALANAFRRILLAEVPTMAIEKVFILNNTSMIQDEVLAHRLGLIPIRADARVFQFRGDPPDDPNEYNVISFRLQVKCTKQRSSGASPGPAVVGCAPSTAGSGTSSDAGLLGSRVTSGDLEWIPQGEQEERFRDAPIAPVHDDILIAKMRPGQEIELEAWCEKGIGKTHAKWSPVCTASYRLLPEITLPKPVTGDDATTLKGMCPTNVFDIEDLAGVPTATVARPRNCTMCRECIRHPGWDERVLLTRVKDHFIFSVESTGALPPETLFQESIKVLMQKASDIATLLKDATAGQQSEP